MTPKFCTRCRHLGKTGGCPRYTTCPAWRKWFHIRWQRIRKAAGIVIEEREYKQDKLEELRQELREEYKERSEGK